LGGAAELIPRPRDELVYPVARMTTRARTALALFVFFQAFYALSSSGNAFRIPDEFELYFQTEHLFDAGDISVPQTLEILQPVVVDGKVVGTQSVFFGKVGQDGKPYAPYGPFAAVLALPHHAAGRALAGLLGIPRRPPSQGLAWVMFVAGITMLTTATAAALAVAGFYRAVIALGTPPPAALWLSLLLGGATVLWPYGTSFYTEAWPAATMIWAAALLLEARTAARPRLKVAIAAILLAVTGLTKVTSLVFAPGFVIAALADTPLPQRRRVQVAAALAAGIAVATSAQLLWNDYRFGSMFDFGFDWSETIPVMPPRTFLIADIARGLVLLLATPGKSVFLWAPLLVLAALSIGRTWRLERGLTIGVATAFAIGLIFYAAYLFPEGGYAHGPRHLVPIVPLAALLAAGPAADRWPRAAWMACGGLGFAIGLFAVTVSFLEDQALRRDARGQVVAGYYELVDPPPGRPNNRYRLGHIPFVTAIDSPRWWQSPAPGQGPDYFPRYLRQVRRQLPDGGAIPESFTWWWPAMWLAVMIGAGVGVSRLNS
jgi:hypothetical protein